MPGSRVPVRGGAASGRLSRNVSVRTLKKYRSDKAIDLTWCEAREAHKQIRKATNLYRLAHRKARGARQGRGPQTRTEIRKAVRKVKTNAKHVIRTHGKANWLKRLKEALDVRENLLADLHYAIRRKGINLDLWSLRFKIESGAFSKNDLPTVSALAAVDDDNVVPHATHPDPPLPRLVYELGPIWLRVTGTSPYPKNDKTGKKLCPFGEWIGDLIKATGIIPPSEQTVSLLVRRQKAKYRVPQ